MIAVVDNDIVCKGAAYRLLPKLCLADEAGELGVLSSARYVADARIKRGHVARDIRSALKALTAFLDSATELDPTSHEQELAADLELGAQQLGVPLDTGESQLCVIAIVRAVPLLLTGDKRAVAAMEQLLKTHGWLGAICGRVQCLEQLVLASVAEQGVEAIRVAICTESQADKALAYCFSCHDNLVDENTAIEGLNSYIRDVRRNAPRVLAS